MDMNFKKLNQKRKVRHFYERNVMRNDRSILRFLAKNIYCFFVVMERSLNPEKLKEENLLFTKEDRSINS